MRVFSNLDFYRRILATFLLALAALSMLFGYYSVETQREEYMRGIDGKLYTAALMAKSILPEDYHDNLKDKTSVSTKAYLTTIDRYNKLCKELGLQYLWSNMLVGDTIVFTSSTSESKEVANGDHALFFDVHSDPDSFTAVLSSGKPNYSTFTNEWGQGRMLLLPFTDVHGRVYVFGASISIDALENKLAWTVWRSAWFFLIIFIIFGFLSHKLVERLIGQLLNLTRVSREIADGDYGRQVAYEGGGREIAILTDSINAMSLAVESSQFRLKKLAEEKTKELRISESYLREIVGNTGDGIMVIDDKGLIETFNHGAEVIYGYKASEIVGKSAELLVPSEARKNLHAMLDDHKEFIASLTNSRKEALGLRADGVQIPVEIVITVMTTETGQKYVGLVRDISEQHQARIRLQDAKIEAERASQAKSEFLSSVSHELRTPLNAIIGFTELLVMDQDKNLNDTQREYLDHIDRGSEHLLELINDILELSKIESGQIKLSNSSFTLASVIDECISLTDTMLEGRDIKVTKLPFNGICLHADKRRLIQVIINLLSNAIKYNQDGGQVTISCTLDDNKRLTIAIEDDGLGIAPENFDRLFEPFERLSAENSNIEGSGVGLSVSKEIVEAMGGELVVTSAVGKGSKFSILLPASLLIDEIEDAERQHASLTVQDKSVDGRVVYIEDNKANIQLMESVFKYVSAELSCRETATEGIELAKSDPPALILMDINLPDMNGFEALTVVRSLVELQDVPVIAISASASEADIQKGLDAGFFRYLSKPFDIAELVEVLKHVLEQRSSDG